MKRNAYLFDTHALVFWNNKESVSEEFIKFFDLFYRLNVLSISLPLLRERKKDIEILAKHFFVEEAAKIGYNISEDQCEKLFTGEALQALENYNWPGNVRQLQNVIMKLSTNIEELVKHGFTLEDVEKAIKESQSGKTPQDVSEKDEDTVIQFTLANIEKAFEMQLREYEQNLFKEYAMQPNKRLKHKVLKEKGITGHRIKVLKKKGLLKSINPNKPDAKAVGASCVIVLTDEMEKLLRKLHSEEKPNE